jgi:hypothetical protein
MDPKHVREWRTFYRHVLNTYGITPAEYRALYLAQSGRCFICRTAKGKHPDDPKARGGRRLAVDHNHVIGFRREAVRGLLCSGGDRTCNMIIGWLDYPALNRAVDYVATSPAQSVLAALAEGYSELDLTGMLTRP